MATGTPLAIEEDFGFVLMRFSTVENAQNPWSRNDAGEKPLPDSCNTLWVLAPSDAQWGVIVDTMPWDSVSIVALREQAILPDAITASHAALVVDSAVSDWMLEKIAFLRGRSACRVLIATTETAEHAAIPFGVAQALAWPFSTADVESSIVGRPARGSNFGYPHPEVSLSLHPATQTVNWSEGLASLTKTEFALLEYLARRRNHFVSHTELLEVVLGARWSYDSSLVRVHLLRIRKKLRELGDIVVTARGRGTRLAVASVSWC